MTTEQASEEQTVERERLSAVFRQMDFEHVTEVVGRALEFRGNASESVRSTLASSIGRSVRLDGFKDASKAHPRQIREPIMWEILEGSDDGLAGAVLRTWAESHAALHDLAVERLGALDIPAEYPDFKQSSFRSEWPRDEWLSECEAFTDDHDDFEFDDVALMMCYVSGRVPEPFHDHEGEPEVESPLFSRWLGELNELPLEAPEWSEIPELVKAISRVTGDKIFAHHRAMVEDLERKVSQVMEGFEVELRYLVLDIGSWTEIAVERVTAVPAALDLIEELNDRLEECEEAILDVAAKWEHLMDEHEFRGDEPDEPGPDSGEPVADTDRSSDGRTEDVGHSSREQGVDESDASGIAEVLVSLRAELDQTKRDYDALSSETSQLRQENAGLRSDKTLLDREGSDLKNELSRARKESESWRKAYVFARRNEADSAAGEPAPLRSVSDALALAERTFPDQLLLALNSKSDGNTPFRKPDELFDVLAWLSTEYHRLRTEPGANPDFNRLVKEACPGVTVQS